MPSDGRQGDLLVELRQHDLPPQWDGLAVVWDGWEPSPVDPVWICPPPRTPECCTACGSPTNPVRNRGRVARFPAITHQAIADNDAARDRLPEGQRWRIKPKALYRLLAFRCPDCKHDVVFDSDTRESWDLDHTDYGDAGSHDPGAPGVPA